VREREKRGEAEDERKPNNALFISKSSSMHGKKKANETKNKRIRIEVLCFVIVE
jgi:hypothetical protein